MARTFIRQKYATEKLDYVFDWSNELASGETISTVDYVVESGLTEESADNTNTTTTSTVWVSGGTAGVDYTVSCTMVSDQGRNFEDSMIIQVIARP